MGDASKRSTRAAASERTECTPKSGKGTPKAKDEEHEFQDFVRTSLLDNKSALENVVQKLNMVLANQAALENRLSELEPKVDQNSKDIKDINDCKEFDSQRISANEKSVEDLQQVSITQSREMQNMTSQINSLQSQVLDMQRYTRGFNIRVIGVDETEDEVCLNKVSEILAEKFGIHSAIENAHRTGPPRTDRPRQIIARFYSRFTRRTVMRSAREKLQNTNIRFVDDLTQKDLEEKIRLKPLMTELYNQNKKPRFIQGRLFANNRAVTQEEIRAFFDKWMDQNVIILVT